MIKTKGETQTIEGGEAGASTAAYCSRAAWAGGIRMRRRGVEAETEVCEATGVATGAYREETAGDNRVLRWQIQG